MKKAVKVPAKSTDKPGTLPRKHSELAGRVDATKRGAAARNTRLGKAKL